MSSTMSRRASGSVSGERPNLDRVSPGSVRVPVPSAVAGTVIALCAVLLLKWLAVVALIACGLALMVRWLWRRRHPATSGSTAAVPDDAGIALLLPAPREGGDDCSWCGLSGGHRDVRGRLVRPRHAHAALTR